MLDASLTETRRLSNYRQTRTFNPLLPEYVSQDWQDIAAFCHESGQGFTVPVRKGWDGHQGAAPAANEIFDPLRLSAGR